MLNAWLIDAKPSITSQLDDMIVSDLNIPLQANDESEEYIPAWIRYMPSLRRRHPYSTELDVSTIEGIRTTRVVKPSSNRFD